MLRVLLKSCDYISVQELAAQLGVSRRTVFREFSYADTMLGSFGLSLDTATGKGIVMAGSAEGRERLRTELDGIGALGPETRKKRMAKLSLALMWEKKPRKLYFYASLLKVSEATVSGDLNLMEPYLSSHGLTLTRRQGYGALVNGSESNIRAACMEALRILQTDIDVYDEQVLGGLANIAEDLNRICPDLTTESGEALNRYLVVMLRRNLDGFDAEETQSGNEAFIGKAKKILSIAEQEFRMAFPESEKHLLSEFLSALRNNAIPDAPEFDVELLKLAYRMIDAFDPASSSTLKLDEDLINGLIHHLKSALVRVSKNIWLDNPMTEEMSAEYPDVMEKSSRAVEVLPLDGRMLPKSEIAFIATHFGAALHRIDRTRRKVKIGVICFSGIGTTYLLAAQIRKQFDSEAYVEVLGQEDIADECDLLLSTIPFGGSKTPVIVTPPFLNDDSIRRIRKEINRIFNAPERIKVSGVAISELTEQLDQAQELIRGAQSLLKNFDVITVGADCSFEELTKLAGYRFGSDEDSGRLICGGLADREKLSTQVIPEMGIILLHCRTEGVTNPVFALIAPEGGKFLDAYLQNAGCAVVMFIPAASAPELTELMGNTSGLIAEDAGFLDAVRTADRDKVLASLEDVIRNSLSNFTRKILKGDKSYVWKKEKTRA
jgi:transcriptional antiterminator/mannitol/fructose-specific phosphotransferase system IIA component (Ntr-type)